jgi:hypothetical protein
LPEKHKYVSWRTSSERFTRCGDVDAKDDPIYIMHEGEELADFFIEKKKKKKSGGR